MLKSRASVTLKVNWKSPGDRVTVRLARRRGRVFYGFLGGDQPAAHEAYLARALKQDLAETLQAEGIDVSVSFGDARTEAGLLVADWVCGAARLAEEAQALLAKSTLDPVLYRLYRIEQEGAETRCTLLT